MKRIIFFSMFLYGLLTCVAQTSRNDRIDNKAQQVLMDITNNMSERHSGNQKTGNPQLDKLNLEAKDVKGAKRAAGKDPSTGHRLIIDVIHNGKLPESLKVENPQQGSAAEKAGYKTIEKKQSDEKTNQRSMSQQDSKRSEEKNITKNDSMSHQQSKGVKSVNVKAEKRSTTNYNRNNPNNNTGSDKTFLTQ